DAVSREARSRSIETIIFANAGWMHDQDIAAEVRPIFSSSYYSTVGTDPVSSRMQSFAQLNAVFRKELNSLNRDDFSAGDIVWIPTINFLHLKALLGWAA